MILSCKKQDDQLSVKSRVPSRFQNMLASPLSAPYQQFNLLGYGYNVTKEYANANSAAGMVIDVSKLEAAIPGSVTPGDNTTTTNLTSYGEDAESVSRDLSGKLNATANYLVFKGQLDASFSKTDNTSSKYVYGFYNLIVQRKSYSVNLDLPLLKQNLSQQFLDYLASNPSPEDIVTNYGTHVLRRIILGGKLQVVVQTQTSNSDRKQAAAISTQVTIGKIFTLNANASANSNSQATASNYSQNMTYVTHGGDPTKQIIGQLQFSNSTPSIDVNDWKASCTAANAELIDIDTDGLIPLYDLIPDTYANLKANLKVFIDQYMVNNRVKTTAGSIYEFYNKSINRHAYNTNPNLGQLYPGYSSNGQPFQAFFTQVAGTVPVYQFYQPNSQDHLLTTNPQANKDWVSYQYDGIIFYAFDSQVSGTVPVYSFFNPTAKDHFYSTNPNAYLPFPGWISHGIAFYAYKN